MFTYKQLRCAKCLPSKRRSHWGSPPCRSRVYRRRLWSVWKTSGSLWNCCQFRPAVDKVVAEQFPTTYSKLPWFCASAAFCPCTTWWRQPVLTQLRCMWSHTFALLLADWVFGSNLLSMVSLQKNHVKTLTLLVPDYNSFQLLRKQKMTYSKGPA